MLRIAVCDDNERFLSTAAGLIKQWSEERNIPIELQTFKNGDEFLVANSGTRFDIVFLDIIMPLLNGMDTARELRQKDAVIRIIFLTSSPEFALDSYEVKAQGYLLKPVSEEKIADALDGCAQFFYKEPENLIIKTSFGYQKLYFHNIEYIEAQNKKVIFFLSDGSSIQSAEPLYHFENRLTVENGFFKCHRSYLIYFKNIDHFNGSEIITKLGRCVPIARGFAKPFKDAYFAMMFEEQGDSYAYDRTQSDT